MKAEELRIGNLIYKWTDIIHVSLQTFENMLFHDSESYNGIPLTEEWLLKFGYSKTPSTYEEAETTDYTNGLSYIDMANQRISFRGNGDVDFNRIKYVHQLQNLYFALTGEELTLTK